MLGIMITDHAGQTAAHVNILVNGDDNHLDINIIDLAACMCQGLGRVGLQLQQTRQAMFRFYQIQLLSYNYGRPRHQ